MNDLRLCDKEALVQMLHDHIIDFDDPETSELSYDELLSRITRAYVIEADEHAVGIIQPGDKNSNPVLWLLWVDEKFRKQNHGRELVSRIIAKYAVEDAIVLLCHNEYRVNFFISCGFEIDSRHDAGISMKAGGKRS